MSIPEYKGRVYYENVLLNAIQQCLDSYGSLNFPVRVEALLSVLTGDLRREINMEDRNVLKPVEETRDYVKLSRNAKPVLDRYKLKYRDDGEHLYVYDTVYFKTVYTHYVNIMYRNLLGEVIDLLNRKGLLLKRRDIMVRYYDDRGEGV